MFTSQTSIRSDKSGRYLQQLCKHFAHKADVQYDTEEGQIDFPMGRAKLAAFHDRLEMLAVSTDEEGLEKVKTILESHLIRFAFRENLSVLEWEEKSE